MGKTFRGLTRYSVAVLTVLAAWAVRNLLDPYLGDLQPFATFYMAVTLVAWWAGRGPALVTLVLGYFASHWFFLPPRHALGLEDLADVVQHLAYFFVTGTILLLMESLRRAKGRAVASAELAAEAVAELNRDICERMRAEKALAQSEARFRTMAETVPDIIFTSQPDGTIDFINHRFYEYAGPSQGAVECAAVLHPEDVAAVESEWQECVRTGRSFEVQCRIRGADGSYRWFLRRARPVRDGKGRILKWVGCCTDIEEQKRAAEVLEQRVAERTTRLQEMVEELELFSYSISHDMRAPLRAMGSYATLIEEEGLSGAGLQGPSREYLRRIKEASAHMDRLILDVLQYSRTVRRSLPLHPVDLSRLLPRLVETYPALLERQASIEVPGTLPSVLGNEAALSQCFGHLLDNAVKFVPPGAGPQIKVWAEAREERVRVWVEDKGIGIPREAQARIFDMFQRAASKDYAGTGIGLAIARKLVQRMDGQMGVDSEPGRGSRFWVELRSAPGRNLEI